MTGRCTCGERISERSDGRFWRWHRAHAPSLAPPPPRPPATRRGPRTQLTPAETQGAKDRWMLAKLRRWKREGLLRPDGTVMPLPPKRRRGRPRARPFTPEEIRAMLR